MNIPTDNKQHNELIDQELRDFPKDASGKITITAEPLRSLSPETRLTLYLWAKSRRAWVADREAFRALDQEFFFSLNSYIGGLKKVDYLKYRHCTAVIEAAEYHRAHFVPKKPVENKNEESAS
jgi:hypothetical protein